jgi:phosphoribosylanthranilate isomerase
MTLIKICGITNLDDALAALDAGADYLGFNFYKESPRYIEPCAAQTIIAQLPAAAMKVGIFVNHSLSDVRRIVKETDLEAAQLHGDEPPEFCAALQANGISAIKAFRVTPDLTAQQITKYRANMVLLDASVRGMYGGTDWMKARELREKVPPVLLAGGLSPENVGEAIAIVKPVGVDAASALESAPGRKDPVRIRAFVNAVRDQDYRAAVSQLKR